MILSSFHHLGGFYDLAPKWKWIWGHLAVTREGLFRYAAPIGFMRRARRAGSTTGWPGLVLTSFDLNHILVLELVLDGSALHPGICTARVDCLLGPDVLSH